MPGQGSDRMVDPAFGAIPGEDVPDGEAAARLAIVQAIEAKLRAAAATSRAARDALPKAHGCVKAEFRDLDTLPPGLRVGVFAAARAFEAWVRFSSGSGVPQADSVGDGRGMAIKLLGVEGSPSGTQDFLLINHPAFFVRNAADYVEFQTASPRWRFFFLGRNPFRVRLREFLVTRAITRQVVSNPLDIRY